MKSYLLSVFFVSAMFVLQPAVAENTSLVVIVNSHNEIDSISADQVSDIFLGKSQRLPNGTKVIPLDQEGDGAARLEFYDKVVQKPVSQLNSYWSRLIFTGRGQPPFAVNGDTEVLEFISSNPNMIGYVELSSIDSTRNTNNIKVLLTIR